MGAKTVFVDFSKIHLTKAEWKLLCAVANSPKRKVDQISEAEHLCELGLAEMYETVGKEPRTQSLFGTSLGNEYIEYYKRRSRERVFDAIKWLLPLLLAVIALVLAIRANVSGGTSVRRTNTTTSSYSTTTNNNNNNNNMSQQQGNSGMATQQNNNSNNNNNNNNASQEPNSNSNNNSNNNNANSGNSGAAPAAGNNTQNNQNNSPSGEASR